MASAFAADHGIHRDSRTRAAEAASVTTLPNPAKRPKAAACRRTTPEPFMVTPSRSTAPPSGVDVVPQSLTDPPFSAVSERSQGYPQ
ncbi:hypothetical protein Sviol_44720 [Streptomyces violascens]|uniref:Uncharacterized protein n=1 Tax=Streptomyces violascens TaxID=67381 RepID=A0ABQ3QS30_9ACTN|nr:hypothetical protein Sviol_44720 [Streptomyces violascens]